MIFKICILLNLLFLIVFKIQANSFPEHLVSFLKQKNLAYSDSMSIIVYNDISSKKWLTCSSPTFIASNTLKLFGLMNIEVICEKIHQFIQVEVKVKGEYIVAARNIKKGKKIVNSDISTKYGYLDKNKLNAHLDKKKILNLMSLKNIKKNELITRNLLRPMWLIKIHQKVSVTIKDIGFIIISEGHAMNNAYRNQKVKIKLDNGTIISGIVNDKGVIMVNR
ncbi:MAG: flagellar basal body P-ring formation chaperone FlgA [Buchnera aphidicola (Kaburagia rhusicola rhusicola)]